jgi:hypothetical protein
VTGNEARGPLARAQRGDWPWLFSQDKGARRRPGTQKIRKLTGAWAIVGTGRPRFTAGWKTHW